MAFDLNSYDLRTPRTSSGMALFHMGHRLLTPGSCDVARLRGYLRLKTWLDCRSTSERVHVTKVAAKLPARALRESLRAIRANGAVAEREGVPARVQLAHLMWLWLRHGVHPPTYYEFRLYRKGQLRRAPLFLQGDEDDLLFRLLHVRIARDEAELMVDKRRFEKWLVAHGFPTLRTLAEFSDGAYSVDTRDGRLPQVDLFVKPNDSLQGFGTERWLIEGDAWRGPSGRRSEEELLCELAERSKQRPLLLQQLYRNAHELACIAPRALGTIRLLTLRDLDENVSIVAAVAKIPTGDAQTDHMRLGGIAAPIEVATGRLSTGVTKAKYGFVSECTHHPDTGVALEGFQMPRWNEACDLAINAHRALKQLVCIGWDIAILDSGPVIVEGNDNPGHTSSQMPTGIALGETPVTKVVLRRLEDSFGNGTRGQITPKLA